ncbi:MAG: sigma-70 family RNA polymerase sigma factor [Bacteroidota bacterium]
MGNKNVAAGKEAAFAALFRTYYPVLYARVFRWCGRPQLANDVVQDVFVSVWESKSDWQQLRDPEAYLTTAARNRLGRLLRRENRPLPPEAFDLPGSEYAELLAAQAEKDQLEQVRSALAKLSPTEQEMLAAKYFVGKTYDELAEATGKEKRTIYNQVFRAVEKLRRVLGIFF